MGNIVNPNRKRFRYSGADKAIVRCSYLYIASVERCCYQNHKLNHIISNNFSRKKLDVLLSHHFCVLSFHFALIRGLTIQSVS